MRKKAGGFNLNFEDDRRYRNSKIFKNKLFDNMISFLKNSRDSIVGKELNTYDGENFNKILQEAYDSFNNWIKIEESNRMRELKRIEEHWLKENQAYNKKERMQHNLKIRICIYFIELKSCMKNIVKISAKYYIYVL